MGKNQASKALDQKLAKAAALKCTSVADAQGLVARAAQLNARVLAAKATAAAADAELKILSNKVITFAQRHRKSLPIDGDRWQLKAGFVRFGKPGSAVELHPDYTMDDVIAEIRRQRSVLTRRGFDVDELITTTESVKFDDLRTLPVDLHDQLGYTVVDTTPEPKLLFGDTKKAKTAAKPVGRSRK